MIPSYAGSFQFSSSQEEVEILENQAQVKYALHAVVCEDWLRELGWFSLERAPGTPYISLTSAPNRTQKRGSFHSDL